ncbi:MAG: hypothetical protein N3D11_13035 [Candidatus Sumerlaeia bacterium]|nr:hypothetical protein [Candidatus Sumerlaeia bacterium]
MGAAKKEKGIRQGKRRRDRWPRVGEILLYVVALTCAAMLITRDPLAVLQFFYSPSVIILLVVAFVTFLIVKGGDRSRLYLLELEKMREREQHYIGRIRRAHEEIQRTLQRNDPSMAATGGTPASSSPLPPADPEECLRRIEALLRPEVHE